MGKKQCVPYYGGDKNIQSLVDIVGCKVDNIPTTKWGMPLGNKHKNSKIWDDTVEKKKGD